MVQPIIQEHIERYSQNEIIFNLLAIIKNMKEKYTAELKELQRKREKQLTTLEYERLGYGSDVEALKKSIFEVNSGVENAIQKILI